MHDFFFNLNVNTLHFSYQVATFHPNFQWAGTDTQDPLNFEKRAPFPTINILRAAKIKKYANEGRTASIAESNKNKLEEVGFDTLCKEFEKIIRLADHGL
jgi:hypothetical protein